MLRRLLKKAKRLLTGSPFPGSEQYWIERYEAGRTSGAGSYNELAEFKAEIINAFVVDHGIQTVMEFGCGDGNQLQLANYPDYTGFDVSPRAVDLCRNIFSSDDRKRCSRLPSASSSSTPAIRNTTSRVRRGTSGTEFLPGGSRPTCLIGCFWSTLPTDTL